MSPSITLLAVAVLVLSAKVNSLNSYSSVNVTRLAQNDKFTNPNRTAVSACLSSGKPSSFGDSCRTFQSSNTRSTCSNACCALCECEDDYPIYLVHLEKCVNLAELNTDVGKGSTGCGGRVKSDNDDDDSRHKHDDICKSNDWTPPLINFQSSYKPEVKFCVAKPKDTDWCVIRTARHLAGFDQWRNVTNLQQRFQTEEKKGDIYLKWSKSLVSDLTGSILIINVYCKMKGKGNKYFNSCFIFKTAGTYMAVKVTPPPTKPTKPTTTKPPSTTANPTTTEQSSTAKTTTYPTTTTTTTTKETTIAKETTTTTAKETVSKEPTTQPIKRTTTISDSESTTTSKEIETTPSLTTEPYENSTSEITMATTEWRSPGKDKIIDTSRDERSGKKITVIIVSVLCTLVAVAVLSFLAVYLLRKRKGPRKAIINSDSLNTSQTDKPENHVYQTQENVYQLLNRDGKSTGHNKWEPPAYQGLSKGGNEGAWGEGEVYTNPSMYQDLKKNEISSDTGYLPAYHPLMKQQQTTTETGPEYYCGYLELVGEHGNEQETADQEDPYYYKVEQIID